MTTPAGSAPPTYLFADLTLDTGQRRAVRQGQTVELSALNFDLLRLLVESAPNVVTSEVLAEKVWGRHFVSPENVTQRVMLLRQSLGDDASQPRYVETVRNKGYRLIPAVQTVSSEQRRVRPRGRRWPLAVAGSVIAGAALAVGTYWRATAPAEPHDALGARTPPPNSIVVLPFENLSPDPAYFAVGMQDQIVSKLTELGSLHVTSRTSAQHYAGAQRSVSEIARELHAATALQGTVTYADGRVRVTAHLSDGATDENLWSQSYEHELGDIFAIQNDIALEVAQALRAELSPAERARVKRVPTTSLPAYVLYTQAITTWSRGRDDDLPIAMREVEQALELDPYFAAAWVLDSNWQTVWQFYDPEHGADHRSLGEKAARSALELDPELGTAHAALGFALTTGKDWTGGEAAYRNALRRHVPLGDMPSYSLLQSSVANFAYAREILEDVKPQDGAAVRGLMVANAALGEWDVVKAQYDFGTHSSAPSREAARLMMHLHLWRNELAQARAIPAAAPVDSAMIESLDNPQAALQELHRLYADSAAAANPSGTQRDIALWAAHFGDASFALDAMRSAVAKQAAQVPYLWLPQLNQMRRLAGFKSLIRDSGIVAYWREYGWPPVCRPLGGDDFECD